MIAWIGFHILSQILRFEEMNSLHKHFAASECPVLLEALASYSCLLDSQVELSFAETHCPVNADPSRDVAHTSLVAVFTECLSSSVTHYEISCMWTRQKESDFSVYLTTL